MSATGKPSSSSLPFRYSRVRAWHRLGLIWQMEDAPAISWSSEPAAFARPDGGGVIVFSSLRPDLRRAASIKGFALRLARLAVASSPRAAGQACRQVPEI